MRKVTYGLLILSLLLLIGCSDKNEVTGAAVSEIGEVSTLIVTVKAENGTLIHGVEITVNDVYKGKTNRYGSNRGSKTIVLGEEDNTIMAEKEGYVPSDQISISSTLKGEQYITIVLEKVRTSIEVFVEAADEAVAGARVSLYVDKEAMPDKVVVTDEDGQATLKRIEDGNYTIKAAKEEYMVKKINRNINYSRDGETISLTMDLIKQPELVIEVVDNEELPLEDAEVTIYTKEEYNKPKAWPLSTKFTNREGQTILKFVELDEEYVVIVKKEGFEAQTLEKVLSIDDQAMHVQMVSLNQEEVPEEQDETTTSES